jgi:hypothetical protein
MVSWGVRLWVTATPGGSGSPVRVWDAIEVVEAVRIDGRFDVVGHGVGRSHLLCRPG